MKKPVAVIILNWNGEKLLSEFLPSVDRFTPRRIADVIVADNGSTDGSLDLLRRDFPDVAVLPFDKNLGFAAGYNRALRETGYRYTVLLNSDVAVKDDWLTPLFDYMEAHPDVAACQPKIRSYRNPAMFEYAGAAGGFLDRNGYPYCRGRIFASVEPDNGQYDDTVDVDWASGACLMVRTADYEAVGGLDASFFAHMEEIDLCWRLRRSGRRVVAVGDAAVFHLGGGSLPAVNPRKTYLNFRNNLLMLRKNLPAGRRRSALIRRRLLDTVAWAKMMATLDFANASAVLKAHRDYRRMAKELHESEFESEADINGRPNILTAFYFKKIRQFSKL